MIFPGQHMPVRTAAERKARDAAFEVWAAEERERIRRQRTYLTALKGTLRDGLVRKMLDRAWELLDCGECEAADALLEFLPDADAEALLREFFPEVYGDEGEPPKPAPPPAPRSRMRCVGDPREPYVEPPSIRRWRTKLHPRHPLALA